MSASLLLLLVSGVLIISLEYKINKRVINVPTVLVVPYLVLIPINNIIMTKYGFYSIDDSVINMLTSGIFAFFAGSIIVDLGKRVSKTNRIQEYVQKKIKESNYRIRPMTYYTLFVEAVIAIRVLLIIRSHGMGYMASPNFEGLLFKGPLGHLLLTIYPLLPIILYYWLNNKRKYILLITYVIGVGLVFLTFVKYHVIGMMVITYLFVSYEDKKYLKKGAILLIGLALSVFVANYLLTFTIRGTAKRVSSSYYTRHLWNYLAGSLIYDNSIFTSGIRVGVSLLYKLGSFSLTPLNFILDALFGFKIAPHRSLPFIPVGTNGERGNVVDAIGYLYPSKGSITEIVVFYIVLILIGALFTIIYNKSLKNKGELAIPLSIFLTFFVFLSFFGTFYISLPPWEILFWSHVMTKIFDRKTRIKL